MCGISRRLARSRTQSNPLQHGVRTPRPGMPIHVYIPVAHVALTRWDRKAFGTLLRMHRNLESSHFVVPLWGVRVRPWIQKDDYRKKSYSHLKRYIGGLYIHIHSSAALATICRFLHNLDIKSRRTGSVFQNGIPSAFAPHLVFLLWKQVKLILARALKM